MIYAVAIGCFICGAVFGVCAFLVFALTVEWWSGYWSRLSDWLYEHFEA